jgi:hypothetical protein
MRTLLAPLFLALIASQTFACTTKVVKQSAPAGETAPVEETPEEETAPPAPAPETYGDPLDPNTPVASLAEVLANPEAYKDKQITTTGTVRQVCQKRGCWAEVRPADKVDSETMRVTFKGYAFFLPKDSRGATVKLEGRVAIQLLSAEQIAHLEEEGATFTNKKADGSALLTEFVASAVEMTGRKK